MKASVAVALWQPWAVKATEAPATSQLPGRLLKESFCAVYFKLAKDASADILDFAKAFQTN